MTCAQPTSLTLSKVEAAILGRLGQRPWQADQLTPEAVRTAKADWLRIRTAAGFRGAGRWFTTSRTSPKLAKSQYDTLGVTLHSATRAFPVWNGLDPNTQEQIAETLGATANEVSRALHGTMCPRSTPGCVSVCVTSQSANSKLGMTDLGRLTRHLFHLFRPAQAFTLTGEGLRKLHAEHGSDCRWRVNVSDDVRWEHLAPGLFTLGVPGYSYTKWSAAERPGFDGFSVVYSATERTSMQTIVELTARAHRVAVVFDVKAADLPTEWNGIPVSDGNVTDDLYEHAAGSIVGLAAKGPTKAIKARMRESGFSRAA